MTQRLFVTLHVIKFDFMQQGTLRTLVTECPVDACLLCKRTVTMAPTPAFAPR